MPKPRKVEPDHNTDTSFRALIKPTITFYGIIILLIILGSYIPWDSFEPTYK